MNKEEKYVIPDLLKISEHPQIKEAVLKRVSGKIRLLLDPLYYAYGAVSTIEEHLKHVKSPKRKAKLEFKLNHWKKVIQVLEEDANAKKDTETKEAKDS